jgi:lipid-binding SYLF domain-containing protein
MNKCLIAIMTVVFICGILSGCATAPKTEAAKSTLHKEVLAAVARFKTEDPGLREFFNDAYGYAVFPSVGKGAVGVGGAYGQGEMFEGGEMVGYCDLSQGTIGLQLGGQAYSELIFFEHKQSADSFKAGTFEFAAQASAVAVTAGASANADYEHGVAVFTLAKGGLMAEASIGGQQFSFQPK